MIANLSTRERVLVIGTILVAVVLGGWKLVIEPIRQRAQMTAEVLPSRERVLMQRNELIARKGALVKDLEAVNGRIDAYSARWLTAAAPPVAASEVQKIAKDIAAAAGTEVRSERILPPVERGELLEIPIEIAVSGEIRNLVDLLTRLDQTPKLLLVQDLKIRVMNITQPKDLLATITLSGFIMPEKAKA